MFGECDVSEGGRPRHAPVDSAGRCGAAWTRRSGAVGHGRCERRWVPKGALVRRAVPEGQGPVQAPQRPEGPTGPRIAQDLQRAQRAVTTPRQPALWNPPARATDDAHYPPPQRRSRDSKAETPSAGVGSAKAEPCACGHLRALSRCACAFVSTPSAMTLSLRFLASVMMVLTISSPSSVPRARTKLPSILSVEIGNRCSTLKDE